ncbi:MAG: hypothetical protein IJG06_10385 [Clostridia bacterium]|nr:hypothetical protein [Clostridia bacterium]MBR0027941.1 hypothetical protein [Clostridia bacterium]
MLTALVDAFSGNYCEGSDESMSIIELVELIIVLLLLVALKELIKYIKK